MRALAFVPLFVFLFVGCGEEVDVEKELERLLDTDREFSSLSVNAGTYEAFDRYMMDDAIIFSEGAHPFKGREAIRGLFRGAGAGTLRWEPFFVDISESGDLGYTLGEFAFTTTDSLGVEHTSTGYYITIWKRQPDGSWRYVFDTGVRSPPPEPKP